MSSTENSSPVINLDDLKKGMEISGKVTRIDLHGAFIDVGLDVEGFLHISMLKRSPLNRVEDVLEVGQEIRGWVQRVNPKQSRLELTMIRPVTVKWNDLKPGMVLQGRVVRLETFGAFVDLGTVRPGLVHVSEMSNDYVSDPSELVQVGDEVQVKVIEVDRKKRQIRLSMKSDEVAPIEEILPEEVVPTAMEVALRQALEQAENDHPEAKTEHEPSHTDREDQEDILQRTLNQRLRTSTSDSS
ncbi:MAG TPA: S1 RNA-binding domain-containing protein [Anaerolineae bacterium]|nr:S1 RNA-binding domain-containing protein [Anaerolineae bacterium]